MRIFKRSFKYISKNIFKSLLILVILFFSSLAIAISFNTNGVLNKVKEQSDDKNPIEVYLYTPEEFVDVADDELNKELYDTGLFETQTYYAGIYDSTFIDQDGLIQPNVIATQSDDYYYTFTDDSKLLTDQQLKSSDYIVVVSDYFLEEYGYEIGDSITVMAYDPTYVQDMGYTFDEDVSYDLEIVGSYEIIIDAQTRIDIDEQYEGDEDLFFEQNSQFYVPAQTIKIIGDETYAAANKSYDDGYNYFLDEFYSYTIAKDQDQDAVSAAVEDIFGGDVEVDFYDSSLNEYYELEYLSSSTSAIITIFAIIAIIMLSLVISLIVRNRKKEVGILISLGESKTSVFLQLLVEIYILCIPVFIIVIPLAYYLVSHVNDIVHFLETILYGSDALYLDPQMSELTYPFSISANIYFIFVFSLIVLVALIIPAIYMLRLKPKKILL